MVTKYGEGRQSLSPTKELFKDQQIHLVGIQLKRYDYCYKLRLQARPFMIFFEKLSTVLPNMSQPKREVLFNALNISTKPVMQSIVDDGTFENY